MHDGLILTTRTDNASGALGHLTRADGEPLTPLHLDEQPPEVSRDVFTLTGMNRHEPLRQ
ncbi:hypothetical protein A176_007045 [Myxococcus hansupus]|uniref:Uncharacterized protein n=1 Tax=Pseudomyxococcus hansupus TaxID=1297742 RepID=A0A0H4X855_9BACT|nr:hypothetical protein A176_007045 [Myxococcus hansupus]